MKKIISSVFAMVLFCAGTCFAAKPIVVMGAMRVEVQEMIYIRVYMGQTLPKNLLVD